MGTVLSLREHRSRDITLDRTGTVVSSTTNRKPSVLTARSDQGTMSTQIPTSCSKIPGLVRRLLRAHRQMRLLSLPKVEFNKSWASFPNWLHRLRNLLSYSSFSAHFNALIGRRDLTNREADFMGGGWECLLEAVFRRLFYCST
jgi:hypothetical protein